MAADYRQMQELQEEQQAFIFGVLDRVRSGRSTDSDALAIASTFGLSDEYRRHCGDALNPNQKGT